VRLAGEFASASVLDLGAVAPDPDGIARAALQLDAATAYLVSMTAYNAAGESLPSNQISVPAVSCDPAACDDGDPCTADVCAGLSCAHAPLPDDSLCGSGGICNAGRCVIPECTRAADCPEANPCDGLAICVAFRCQSGPPLACPEPGPCQQGGCRSGSGCWLADLPDGSPCDDGDAQTSGDQCHAGRCTGSLPAVCTSSGPDLDADGVPDACDPDLDGDAVPNDADNCAWFANPAQSDDDANGIGNDCECGDQSGDGAVTVSDITSINAAIFGRVPVSPLCDANGDGLCNISDILGVSRKLMGHPARCARYPRP